MLEILKSVDLKNFVNVREFGAKGDGVADDTNAINGALASLSSTGGIVFVPPGTYVTSAVLLVYSNTHLMGAGMHATTIQRAKVISGSSRPIGIADASTQGSTALSGSLSGITLSDFTFDANFPIVTGTHDGGNGEATLSDSTASFITAGVKANDTLENITEVVDFAMSTGSITAVGTTTLTAAVTDGRDGAAVTWDTGDSYRVYRGTRSLSFLGVSNLLFDSVRVLNSGMDAFFTGASTSANPSNIELRNCVVGFSLGNSIGVYDVTNGNGFTCGSPVRRVRVYNCHFFNPRRTGVRISAGMAGVTEVSVESCLFNNWGVETLGANGDGDGISVINGQKVRIVDNIFYDHTRVAAAIETNTGTGTTSDMEISNNIIDNCRGGISLSGSSTRANVTGNQVRLAQGASSLFATSGIQVNNDECVVNDNFVSGATQAGITVISANDITISNNIIKNTLVGTGQARGINIGTASSDIAIKGNRIYDDQGTKTQTHGIALEGTADYCVIEGNDVRGNSTAGMLLVGDNNLVRNNMGWATENSGTATVLNTTNSIVVNHGLDVTPVAGDVMVVPIESLGAASFFYVDTLTATQFTINTDIDPGQDVDFAWKAQAL